MAGLSPATALGRILALFTLLASLAHAYDGEGTAYGSAGGRGSGACGIGGDLGIYETYYAAMNHAQYGGSCGKCIKVCGKAGCVVLKVVDMCPGCSHGDVDMSSEALKKCTGYSWDRKPISWDYVPCSGGSTSSKKGSKKRRSPKKKSPKKKCKGKRCKRNML